MAWCCQAQAIARANSDPDLWRYMASVVNELNSPGLYHVFIGFFWKPFN